MAIRDWRKVSAGIFYDFHNAWIAELRKALNHGILPSGYYALIEQTVGDIGPDVWTLQAKGENGRTGFWPNPVGIATITSTPPKVRLIQRMEKGIYARKRKTLVIRHSSDDRVIALIEILSPGNKASKAEFSRFLDKAVSALNQDVHLLLVDLFPPTKRDPQGIHGAILNECENEMFQPPEDKPLTVVSYSAGLIKTAYVEPIAVGDALPTMSLFLDPESYVRIPLEATYVEAYGAVPWRWREVLEK